MHISTSPWDLKSLGLGNSGGIRAAGLHASDIYNDLYKSLVPKKYGKFTGPPDPMLVEIGLIFESMLEEGLKRRIEANGGPEITRPGEFSYQTQWDDRPVTIHYNPDLFIFNGVFRIGEIKSTWMWSGLSHEEVQKLNDGTADPTLQDKHRDLILDPKYDKYHTQAKFYCYMQRTNFARLYIFYVTANGRPPFPAQFPPPWDIEYTDDELESNFAMLMNHASARGMF